MGLFIKCCAVHIPSTNPKKPPARRISDTLTRPMNTLRRMVRTFTFTFTSCSVHKLYYVLSLLYSDIHMVVVELAQGVYPQDQVKDMARVDLLMVMERVEVLNIIQKVN